MSQYSQSAYSRSTYPSQMHQGQMLSSAQHPARASTNAFIEAGKFGAVVGLCGAGAANLRRLQANQIDAKEAVVDSVRTSVAAGLATAAASLVASRFSGSATSLAATIATGTLAMYLLGTERLPAADAQSSGDEQ